MKHNPMLSQKFRRFILTTPPHIYNQRIKKFKIEFKRKIILFYYNELYRYIYINGSISRSYNRAADPTVMLQIL